MVNVYFYIRNLKGSDLVSIYYGLTSGKVVLKRKTTGIKIPKKLWDSEKQTIKSSREYDPTEELLKLNSFKEDLLLKYQPGKQKTTNEDDCFLSFVKRYLNSNSVNYETSVKYHTIVKSLERFVKWRYGSNRLPISILRDHEFGYFFRDFLLKPSDNQKGSGLKTTKKKDKTIKNYLSVLNSFIRKYNEMYQRKNPISLFPRIEGRSVQDPTPVSLNLEELFELEDLDLSERQVSRKNQISNSKLNITRNIFLFQYYCLGMRISDCLLLQTSNFSKDGIRYRMKKTGSIHLIPPHFSISNTLKDVFPKEFEHSLNTNLLGEIPLSGNEIKDFVTKMGFNGKKTQDLNIFDVEEFLKNHKDNLPDNQQLFLEQLHEKMGILICSCFFEMIGKLDKRFVFPFLDILDFKDIDSLKSNELNEIQNKKIHRVSVLYNKYLSKISEILKWDKKISGHTPRHSFSNTLHENDGTLEEINLTLGHKSIPTTMLYLRRFPNKVRESGIKKFQKLHKIKNK